MIPIVSCRSDSDWLATSLQALRDGGCALVTGVLGDRQIEQTRDALYRVQHEILEIVGEDKLRRAGEIGVLRIPMLYDPYLLKFLEIPEVLAIVDNTVSPTAILHLQNGFVTPPMPRKDIPDIFQNNFHMDFPRVLNGYLMSVNCFFAISDFTEDRGGIRVVPGSHQTGGLADQKSLAAQAVPVACLAGSMIVFDSTLYHAAGHNVSGQDRLAINHQFTRSYIKQQIDYPRALGERVRGRLADRTAQLLGHWTRTPASLDEYYRPPDQRLYRPGQG